MWIAKSKNWNISTTVLEKFAVERILQRCDFTETITNKHRTSNGYTQLKELIIYCELTQKRSKTVKTLIVLIDEAKSNYVRQSITSDYIIANYFEDLKKFIDTYDTSRLLVEKGQPNIVVLQNLTQKLKLFEKQLDGQYFSSLVKEFKKLNYSEKKEILRNSELLSKLIDLLVPYLVFKGYSLATISEILRQWLTEGYHITISKFLSFFHFNKRPFYFLQFLGQENSETRDFIELIRSELNVDVEEVRGKDLGSTFLEKHLIGEDEFFASYAFGTLDPHMHVRSNFDSLLKKLVIIKERQSLAVFNRFFEHSYWNNKHGNKYINYRRISLEGDSINVNGRATTLRTTLTKCSSFYSTNFSYDSHLPNNLKGQLYNAVYYYNLALGSKSIESSLSLLWTSLEAIQPYRIYTSDIDAIQSFVSKGLSLGAVARDIYAFALRVIQSNQQNDHSLDKLGTRGFDPIETSSGLINWYAWMLNKKNNKINFDILKSTSELLAYEFVRIAKPLTEKTQVVLLDRIKQSENSVKYQLQRIYLHRNKIVHSGDMVNEYTNLWMHLEWYVGKMLAFFIIQLQITSKSSDLENAFLQLEADQDYLVSYLEKHKNDNVRDISDRILEIIFKYPWQAF